MPLLNEEIVKRVTEQVSQLQQGLAFSDTYKLFHDCCEKLYSVYFELGASVLLVNSERLLINSCLNLHN